MTDQNKKAEDYEGSEEQFQDLLSAAGRATAYHENPQTLIEAGENLSIAWRELLTTLGFFELMDGLADLLNKLKRRR